MSDFDITKLIAWLEGRAANTDTDPRWLAARELRRAVELDLMPTHFAETVAVHEQAKGGDEIVAAPAAAWRGLTKDEHDVAVGELIEYGIEFVAPLYAVIEGVERKLKERNAGVKTVDVCPCCDSTTYNGAKCIACGFQGEKP